MDKFKIGDEVILLDANYEGNKPDLVPSKYIKHGAVPSTGSIGTIKAIHNEYFIVYLYRDKTQFGFLKESLKLVKSTSTIINNYKLY